MACVGEVYDKLAAHFKTVGPVKKLEIYKASIPDLLKKLQEIALGEN